MRTTLRSLTMATLLAALFALLAAPLASAQSSPVGVEYRGLEPLGAASIYEGWLIVDGAPQSTGTFNVDASGNLVNVQDRPVANASAATAFVLTIEPAVDPDPAPAATKLLGGDFVDGVAQLSIAHPAALGTDFSTASGGYIVATPTTASDDDNLSGVWFLDPAAGPGPSLDLPALPAGWVYEGWVVLDGNPLSTGRFTSASGSDSFGGFSGPDGTPPFPGEDFIVNAPPGLTFPTDVSGATVVISVEPAPDDGPAPFALKPLVGSVPSEATVGTLYPLGDGPVGISGVATLSGGNAGVTVTGEAVELAFTGAESWLLAGGGAFVIAVGGAFVAASRRFENE